MVSEPGICYTLTASVSFCPGEKMNVRKELNARLYNQKTEDMTMPHYRSGYAKYVAICNGETETVSTQLKSGSLALECNVRILSKNSLKNAVYHFVLSASAIAEACMEAGMGHVHSQGRLLYGDRRCAQVIWRNVSGLYGTDAGNP